MIKTVIVLPLELIARRSIILYRVSVIHIHSRKRVTPAVVIKQEQIIAAAQRDKVSHFAVALTERLQYKQEVVALTIALHVEVVEEVMEVLALLELIANRVAAFMALVSQLPLKNIVIMLMGAGSATRTKPAEQLAIRLPTAMGLHLQRHIAHRQDNAVPRATLALGHALTLHNVCNLPAVERELVPPVYWGVIMEAACMVPIAKPKLHRLRVIA
jgi:hypothetical protein